MLHRAARRLAVLALVAGLAGSMTALAAPGAPTAFQRDPALLRAKQQQVVSALRAQNPQAADALQKAFGQDMMATLGPELRRMGLDPNDMADMTAAYWVNAWEASNGVFGGQTAPALVAGAKRQMAELMARNALLPKMTDAQKQEVADTMLLQGLLIAARAEAVSRQGPAAQKAMSDAIARESAAVTKTDLRAVTLTAEGFKPKTGAQPATAPPAASPAPARPVPAAGPTAPVSGAAGRFARNWDGVEGVYFRLFYTFGVGGMMIADYQPVVLFKDGSYYRVEGQPLEDIDLAASRAAKPVRWGRWSQSPAGYVLVDEKGKAGKPLKLQDGQFFKAYAADAAGGRLSDVYTRVSGGGNTALGGDTMIAFQTDIAFAPDGTYGRKSGGGGSNSGQYTGASVVTTARSGNDGRYQIARYTISTTQPDGGVKRQFFAFGSQGTPPRPDTEMMFMGDTVYTVMSKNKRR